jgi:hypothetical protein
MVLGMQNASMVVTDQIDQEVIARWRSRRLIPSTRNEMQGTLDAARRRLRSGVLGASDPVIWLWDIGSSIQLIACGKLGEAKPR